MQSLSQTLLAVLLAHLCSDFPLQNDSIIEAKKNGTTGYLAHGAIHYVAVMAALILFTQVKVWTRYSQALLVGYVILHLALDYLKQLYVKNCSNRDSTGAFVVDQAFHVLTAAALAWAITGVAWKEISAVVHQLDGLKRGILQVAVTYVAVVFAGGYLVRSMTRSLTDEMPAPEGEDKDALRNAGLYIGWLERFLVLTALLVQSPSMIGLILTGKSIARLGELKGPKFAEYFLIGTLLSVSLALTGGIMLMLALYGTISPK